MTHRQTMKITDLYRKMQGPIDVSLITPDGQELGFHLPYWPPDPAKEVAREITRLLATVEGKSFAEAWKVACEAYPDD